MRNTNKQNAIIELEMCVVCAAAAAPAVVVIVGDRTTPSTISQILCADNKYSDLTE